MSKADLEGSESDGVETALPEVVLDTPWFRVEATPGPNLGDAPYYQISQSDGVVVIAVTREGRLLLIRQYRPPLKRRSLETPAGFIDKGETPAEAARREIYEETGYHCDEVVELGPVRTLMNRLTSREHMVLVTGAYKDSEFRPREAIEVVEVEPEDFRRMVRSGEFEQVSAMAALFLAQAKLGWRLGAAGAPSTSDDG